MVYGPAIQPVGAGITERPRMDVVGMFIVLGELLGVSSFKRNNRTTGEEYTVRSVQLLVGRAVTWVQLSKKFDESHLPAERGLVAIQVSIEPYVTKQGAGAYSLTGWEVAPLTEADIRDLTMPRTAAAV